MKLIIGNKLIDKYFKTFISILLIHNRAIISKLNIIIERLIEDMDDAFIKYLIKYVNYYDVTRNLTRIVHKLHFKLSLFPKNIINK